MRAPLRLRLEYLASTFGIEDLGMAWIQTNPDGSRSLVLSEAPTVGLADMLSKSSPDLPVNSAPLTEDEFEHAIQAMLR